MYMYQGNTSHRVKKAQQRLTRDLLPFGLVAQSVEQRWSNLEVTGPNPADWGQRIFLCLVLTPISFIGLNLKTKLRVCFQQLILF